MSNPVNVHEIEIQFGKGDNFTARQAALTNAVLFYSRMNGYQIIESWLTRKGYDPIDDFARDNIMHAEACVIRYVKTRGNIDQVEKSPGRPDFS